MSADEDRISVRDEVDPYARNVVLGDLTERQYAALEEVARLSPGYSFVVTRYGNGPSSSATHVMVWRNDNDREYVGLVGRGNGHGMWQYYDGLPQTEAVVKRVMHRVYR